MMRLGILCPVLFFSILLISGCSEEKPVSLMPVTTDSALALELYETSMIAFDQAKFSLAWHNLELAVKEDPDFFMAYFWMYFMSSKEYIKVVEKALSADIVHNPAEEEIRMAIKYLVDGQDEKVIEHLQNMVDLYPSDPQTHKILYILQFQYMKDYEGSIISIEHALKECPDFPLAYNQLGYAHMMLEQFEGAEEAFDTYIELAPDQGNPYDSKGDYFIATKQYEKAYECYMKAYENDSSFEVSRKKAKKAKSFMAKAEHLHE